MKNNGETTEMKRKKRMSQNDRILNHLQNGGRLTPLAALEKFGCFRLSGRIFELKEKGYNIEKVIKIVGDKKRVAEYFIPQPQQTI